MTELTTRPTFFLDPAAENFSIDEISRIRRTASRLQGEMVSRHFAIGGGALWRAAKWLGVGAYRFFGAVMAGVSARNAYDALSRLSDADLERIGLTRDEIPQRVSMVLDAALNHGGGAAPAELRTFEGGRKGKRALPQSEMPSRRAA